MGSRYLQGLATSEEDLDIWVFDVSIESLKRAEIRWSEVKARTAHRVSFVTSISDLPQTLQLVIVATTADVRAELVERISTISKVRYWILEKILGQNKEDLHRIERVTANGSQAWVNTPRLQWELYKKLRSKYQQDQSINVNIENFSGLACNAIHFIDFVCRWSGAKLLEVDTQGLNSKWHQSKRAGFYEIDGYLGMRFNDGSSLKLASQQGNIPDTVTLDINGQKWTVDEAKGMASTSDGQIVVGKTELQSQLTSPTVRAILYELPCGLPTLAQSIEQHEVFLDALMSHWNTHMPEKLDRLPIT